MAANQLSYNMPIVDPHSGKPTGQFIQQWNAIANSGGSGGSITLAQITAALDLIGHTEGDMLRRGPAAWLAIGSPGGTTTFLRADGTWAAPPAPATPALSTLPDVSLTALNNNNLLTWDTATSRWKNKPAIVPALSSLSDVVIASLAAGQVLAWDTVTSKWKNQTVAGGTLAALTDVSIPTPAGGQVLTFNAGTSKWNGIAPSGPAGGGPVTIVQSVSIAVQNGLPACTLGVAPTPGNMLIFIAECWLVAFVLTPGWTMLLNDTTAAQLGPKICYRQVRPGDTAAQTPSTTVGNGIAGTLFEVAGAVLSNIWAFEDQHDKTGATLVTNIGAPAKDAMVLGIHTSNLKGTAIGITGATQIGSTVSDVGATNGGPHAVQPWFVKATAKGAIAVTGTYATAGNWNQSAYVVFGYSI